MSPSLQPTIVFLDRAPSVSSQGLPYAGPVQLTDSLTGVAKRVWPSALLSALGPYSVGVAGAHEASYALEIANVEATFPLALTTADGLSPVAMPWITTYLDDGADKTSANSPIASDSREVVEAVVQQDEINLTPNAVELAASEPTREDWPLLEAGQRLSELAAELRAFERADTSESRTVSHAVSTPSLPMWSDDELMDIMPVTHSTSRTPTVGEWATTARRDFDNANNPEAAAVALERLAAKVRAGTVQLPQFSTDLGDAGVLVVALGALLGSRH